MGAVRAKPPLGYDGRVQVDLVYLKLSAINVKGVFWGELAYGGRSGSLVLKDQIFVIILDFYTFVFNVFAASASATVVVVARATVARASVVDSATVVANANANATATAATATSATAAAATATATATSASIVVAIITVAFITVDFIGRIVILVFLVFSVKDSF
jgi:hypothetical protein